MEEFDGWLQKTKDTSVKYVYQLMRREMCALSILRASLRHDSHAHYECARKVLLPLLYNRGHHVYGPLVLRDFITMQTCSPEVKAEREKLLGQGARRRGVLYENRPRRAKLHTL